MMHDGKRKITGIGGGNPDNPVFMYKKTGESLQDYTSRTPRSPNRRTSQQCRLTDARARAHHAPVASERAPVPT